MTKEQADAQRPTSRTPADRPRGDQRWAAVAGLVRLACGPTEGQLEVVVPRSADGEPSSEAGWASAIPNARVVEVTEAEFPGQVHELLARGASVLALPP